MTIQTVKRQISAALERGGAAEEFTYNAVDFAHYSKLDIPALREGAAAMVEFAKSASDIKAQAAYRRKRAGSKTEAALSAQQAADWMFTEYEGIPGTRVRLSPVEKMEREVGKLDKSAKAALLAKLQAELALEEA